MSDSQNLFLDPANPLGLRYVISGLLRGNFSLKLEDLFCLEYIESTIRIYYFATDQENIKEKVVGGFHWELFLLTSKANLA